MREGDGGITLIERLLAGDNVVVRQEQFKA